MKEREMNLQMHRVRVKFEIGALPGELNIDIDVPAYYDTDQVAKKTRALVRKSYRGSFQIENITIVDRKVIQ